MLAIIPARGGSKGVPGKNIKTLCGKPLIAYTIEAARASKKIDRIILSTDDEEIVSVCRDYDIEVPFMRPSSLARDNSSALDVYLHTLERLNTEGQKDITEFMVLQPTSPLRGAEDIDNAVDLFLGGNADSIISVSESIHPPIWAKKIDADGVLRDYFPEMSSNKNRQEIDLAYMPNGAIYILKLSLLQKFRTYYSDKTLPYIMPAERSVDIDTPLDFEFAEFLLGKSLSV